MIRRIALAGIAVLAAVAPPAAGWAQTAPAAKPLRTLVYSVQFTATTTNEEHTSGFTGTGGATPYGNATTKRAANVDDTGMLTANIVAASGDGGLVVDASFAGKTTTQPAVRVAVFPDGHLSYAPGADLSPQAARVLPLLARGLIAERDVSPGSSWTIPAVPPTKGSYTYHVTTMDGDTATFAIDIDTTLPGPKGFDEHGKATAVYDTVRLCPTRYDLVATSRHQPAMDQYVTSNAHLTATLVSDTFAKK
jgi:hypothetical protein